MYTQFFHLQQPPFSIAPDPRYLFMSERHREALAHLLFGVGGGGGFVLLTGEIGAGKTTVCRCFMEQIPADCKLGYIFNPKLTVPELLQAMCEEFGVERPPASGVLPGVKAYIDVINRYLLESHARGINNVLIIDEAQNLSPGVLEQLRLLTNLETSRRKLLQIILVGQPELRGMLARPDLEQLAQRVIARYHLGPLSGADTANYIAHRLAVAGASGPSPFPPGLTGSIERLSGGIPRRINLLCDRALLGAYVEGRREVTRAILKRAAAEVFGADKLINQRALAWRWPVAALLGLAAVGAAGWQLMPPQSEPVRLTMPAQPAKPAEVALPAPAAPLVLATQADALRELASLWKAEIGPGEPCEQAARVDLRCYQGRGGLYDLRQLDRPAVLTVHEGATTGYALLVGMDDAHATLRSGGRTQRVPLAQLATRFDGAYTTFWSFPRTFREQVPSGWRGPEVDWIAARLARLDRTATPVPGTALDGALQRRLRTFQAEGGLKADGVAGPRTFMRLNRLTGAAEPHLLAEEKR